MEKISHCLICGSLLTGKTHLSAKDYLYSGRTFAIEKCCNCSFLLTNPRPDAVEIKTYYNSDEYISHTNRNINIRDRLYHSVRKIMLKRKIKLINKHKKNNEIHLLDYGCGTGSFVVAAKKAGYASTGYEPDNKARDFATNKGASVISTKEEVFSDKAKYNIITLWHVLEHLHEFPEILNDFYNILNKNGLLVIALPMANSFDAMYYKQYWAALDLPRHLYHFTPETIELACKQAGYVLLRKKGMTFDSFYVSLLSEKYKQSKTAAINAFIIGCLSNMKALMKKQPWSSEIFIFKKMSPV